MIIQNRLAGRKLVIQPARWFVAQQEVVVDKAHGSISITLKPKSLQAVLLYRKRPVDTADKSIPSAAGADAKNIPENPPNPPYEFCNFI
jgi:hypothetical protein